VQSVPITTKIVSLNPSHGKVRVLDTTLCEKVCQLNIHVAQLVNVD